MDIEQVTNSRDPTYLSYIVDQFPRTEKAITDFTQQSLNHKSPSPWDWNETNASNRPMASSESLLYFSEHC